MKIKNILRTIMYAVFVILVMIYGVLIEKWRLPPYSIMETGYKILFPNEYSEVPKKKIEISKEYTTEIPKRYIEIPKEYIETDVASIISITQVNDISERRDELTSFLWGKPELPISLPSAITMNWRDVRYADFRSLQKIDKVVVSMEFGLESVAYHFIPKNPKNKLVLYHQGHRGDFIHSKEQIRQFVDNGYAVMAFSMPLLGLNNQPSIDLSRIGKLKINTHDHMKFLSPANGHSIKYFIEPVITALNYLEKNYTYNAVSMVGISGGGWTTTIAAAVDTRITYSFPVAGSLPIYLRSNSRSDWGDYEQNYPELYKTVNYLELYVLGSYGENRKQLQIINQFDSCCFAGKKWETYKDIVRSRIFKLGSGEFDLFLDDSHQGHFVSDVVMGQIFDEIEKH